jgi:sterol desaturase/sphingolipid hydroxylase (fatty acid hydroxylase superfamily)
MDYLFLPLFSHIGLWTLVTIFFYILDHSQYKKYRLNRTEINYQKYNEALICTYINMFTVLVPIGYIFGIYLLPCRQEYFNLSNIISNTTLLVIIETLLMIAMNDVSFYISHYLLHTKYMYKYHKKHHEYIEPVVSSGYYFSTIEMIINVLSTLIIPYVIGAHPYSFTLIVSLTALHVTMTHSGYKTYLFATEEHETHHRYPNKNYGTYLFMDKIFNTYYNNNLVKRH